MRLCLSTLFAACVLAAADPQLLTLGTRAQSDFDRVERVAEPQLGDTAACVQSQAALLPVAGPGELALLRYRKGYCILAGAAITRNAAEFSDAAAEFDKAAAVWPLPKGTQPAPPVSPALPVLAAIARLEADSGGPALDRAEAVLAVALSRTSCGSSVISAAVCDADLRLGRLWLGWIAFRHGNLIGAAREFSVFPDSAWSNWVSGRQAFESRRYHQAAEDYGRAIDRWWQERRQPAAYLQDRLRPQPDMAANLADLGGAQLLAGDATAAIATLDQALREAPDRPATFYLRARAKELAGQTDAAQTDYNLASRTAFALAQDLASGEAHLYRGILLYRRRDLPRAEQEFASALNFDISPALRADASAWRHLAAVASGSCGASREELARSLVKVSPYFPRNEAGVAMDACTASAAAAAFDGAK